MKVARARPHATKASAQAKGSKRRSASIAVLDTAASREQPPVGFRPRHVQPIRGAPPRLDGPAPTPRLDLGQRQKRLALSGCFYVWSKAPPSSHVTSPPPGRHAGAIRLRPLARVGVRHG